MRLCFTKMSGAGNDFVVLDGRPELEGGRLGALARFLCDRRRAIGADGVLVLEKGTRADCLVRYYNADGSEAAMCGNGARCAALRARALGMGRADLTLDFGGSVHAAWVREDGVRVSLGAPRGPQEELHLDIGGRDVVMHVVDTGVPHVVLDVPRIAEAPVASWGPLVRHHASFAPEGSNVDFVELRAEGPIPLRTYERGVEGETLACGTGAAAAALVARRVLGRPSPVEIRTWGGHLLRVHWREEGGHVADVILEGEARVVFRGEMELSVAEIPDRGEGPADVAPGNGGRRDG